MKKPDWVVCLNMSHFTFCSQVSLSARSAFESFCFQFYSDDLSPEVKAWTQKKQTIENILPDTKIFASFYPPNPTHHHKSIQIRRVHCKYLLQRVCQLSVVGSGANVDVKRKMKVYGRFCVLFSPYHQSRFMKMSGCQVYTEGRYIWICKTVTETIFQTSIWTRDCLGPAPAEHGKEIQFKCFPFPES